MLYGHDKTLHKTTYLDVEVHDGKVVGVWFRCLSLPFSVQTVHSSRAAEMRELYRDAMVRGDTPRLIAVDVENPNGADNFTTPRSSVGHDHDRIVDLERRAMAAEHRITGLEGRLDTALEATEKSLTKPTSRVFQVRVFQVRYIGATDAQVQFGSYNSDPRGMLKPGEVYEVMDVEEHTWHTKYRLRPWSYLWFNSVHFEPVDLSAKDIG